MVSALAVAALAPALSCCSLISLGSLDIATEPAIDGEIVAAGRPIRVSFSIEPERTSAERAFKLSSAAGTQAGDIVWSGNELDFYPVPPLKKGYLWTLSIAGNIKAADGRSFDASKIVTFYAGSNASLLTVSAYSPATGSTASTSALLKLHFSRAPDQSLFKRNFSLSPSTDYAAAWSEDGLTATVSPKARWTTLTTYSWQVKADLADSEGVGMARSYEGNFIVQDDGTMPSVVSVRPALFTNGNLAPLAVGLDQLGYRDALYFTFSGRVTLETVADAIKLTPAVQGRVLQNGFAEFAFVPDDGFAARTEYRLSVLSSVADLAGNTMSEDYVAWFAPRIAALRVASVSIDGGPAIADFGDAFSYGFSPSLSDESGTFAIVFGSPIADLAQRDRIVTLVSCASLFPSSLSPSLKSAQWVGGAELDLTFAGFAQSTASKTNYYKLLVPGGTSGISDGAGGTMEKDLWLVLYTAL
jgi:hypothetical protein